MRRLAALALCAALLIPTARAVDLSLDGAALSLPGATTEGWTTLVPLRAAAAALDPTAAVTWEDGQAVVRTRGAVLTAVPGEDHLTVNGVELPGPVRAIGGRTFVPIRPLSAVLGAEVTWSPETGVALSTAQSEDLYWLSRIINAESRGEPFSGQIAVGNVVLNRAASADFPSTIHGVIFDDRWGGQFEPVRNGTVYLEPEPSCVLAARLCLAGASTAGESLYFLAPALTSNHWTMENRDYVTTIGAHWFYR